MATPLRKTLLLPSLLALLPIAQAQTVGNSRFDNGLAGWTVATTIPGSLGAPGDTAFVDMDGPGPLGTNPAARFNVGKAPGETGVANFGITLSQTVQLEAGRTYTARFDWSSANSGPTFANGGRYSLLVNGALLEVFIVGGVGSGNIRSGVLSDTFTASTTGPGEFQIRIDSTATVLDPPTMEHRVDNVRLETGFNSFPGFLPVSGGGVETMVLDAGSSHALETYLILGSLSGPVPGIDLPLDVHLPLNFDPYTNAILNGLAAPPFTGFFGVLDEAGQAMTTFILPSGLSTSAVGLELTHAYLTLDPSGVAAFGSNPDTILLF
ncbi:MAG: hypothetical protein AAFZ65_11925 [Planctomycetota bacterium]